MATITHLAFGTGITEGVKDRTDPGSLSGRVLQADRFKITSESPLVHARIGVTFGVRFRIQDPSAEKIAYYQHIVRHPPMRNPSTNLISTGWSDYLIGRNHGWNFTFFTFEHEWELVSGEWAFDYCTYEGELLATVTFLVS